MKPYEIKEQGRSTVILGEEPSTTSVALPLHQSFEMVSPQLATGEAVPFKAYENGEPLTSSNALKSYEIPLLEVNNFLPASTFTTEGPFILAKKHSYEILPNGKTSAGCSAIPDYTAFIAASTSSDFTSLDPQCSDRQTNTASGVTCQTDQAKEGRVFALPKAQRKSVSISPSSAKEIFTLWQMLSEETQLARYEGTPWKTNDELRKWSTSDLDSPLSPLLLVWLIDNFCKENRFEEAILTANDFANKFGQSQVFGHPLLPMVLHQKADAFSRLSKPSSAIETYSQAVKLWSPDISKSYTYLKMAGIAEDYGNLSLAEQLYSTSMQSSDQPFLTEAPSPELARRNLVRMRSRKSWIRPSIHSLLDEISLALWKKDEGSLLRMASPTHFRFGAAASELDFVNPAVVLKQLAKDLRASHVVSDSASAKFSRDSCLLSTNGWIGSLLIGEVIFAFTRISTGWEWSGIGILNLAPRWEEHFARLFGPVVQQENQPAQLTIATPWPAGWSLRAGGITARIARGVLDVLSFGLFSQLEDLVDPTPPGCSGPAGYYYAGGNHGYDQYFSIDFAGARVFGLPALSIAYGAVLALQAGGATNSWNQNFVDVQHYDVELTPELVAFNFTGKPRAQMRYVSRYFHFDGPNRLFVSNFMYVRPGTRLGPIDSTGTSIIHHLHLELHDNQLPSTLPVGNPMRSPYGASIRITPMQSANGPVILHDSDSGRCITSNTIPRP